MKHFNKTTILSLVLLGSTFAVQAGKKRKEPKSSVLPYVDLSGSLRVEVDQFGRSTVIGTPEEGPDHGPGSYFYQIAYLGNRAVMKINFANYVAQFLNITGRFGEYVPGAIAIDESIRRQSYTLEQVGLQIKNGIEDGTIPLDVIDYIDGLNQAVLDHIKAIEDGEEPLPADFVEGVGILNYWWAERNDEEQGAASLFTRETFAQLFLIVDIGIGSGSNVNIQGAFNVAQLIDANNLSENNPQVQDLFDDIYGYLGVNTRFTVAEGDRAGVYCPTVDKPADQIKGSSKYHSRRLEQEALFSNHITAQEKESFIVDLKTQRDKREEMGMLVDPSTTHSDFLVIDSKLTKNKSTLMYGNSQLSWGFNRVLGFRVTPPSYITPRATSVWSGESYTFIRSSGTYGIHYSTEVSPVLATDGIWETPANLTLIDDSNTPGGTSHSTLIERLSDGTTTEKTIDIFQGKERKSIETDLRSGPLVYMARRPQTWMRDAAIALRGLAAVNGILPFNNLEEYANNMQSAFIQMYAGLDTDGNIFTLESGIYQDPDTEINRILPGDATGGFVESLVRRPMPFVPDDQYVIRPGGLVVNPPCGFITGWNNNWANDRQTPGRRFAYQRVGSIFDSVDRKIKEKGKLAFEDVIDLWSSLTYRKDGASVTSSDLNFEDNPWPIISKRLIKALKRKGEAVGLTKEEVKRTIKLLQCYDGRSIPANDQPDVLTGLNYDGRWVLSQIWLSFVTLNLFERAFPDKGLYDAAIALSLVDLSDREPRGDWTINTPNQSRVQPVGVGSSSTPANTIISVLNLGADLGNIKRYPWLETAGLTSEISLDLFYAQALKDALSNQSTGTNADLVNPETGRANLNLIKENGIPLHPGWGRFQRPTTLPNQFEHVTQFLLQPFNVLSGGQPINTNVFAGYPSLGAEGDRKYVERDCKGRLIHNQNLTMLGAGGLVTVDEEGTINVDPQATAMDIYFRGNYQTDEIPVDIKPTCKK